MLTSSDGLAWTEQITGTFETLTGIAHDGSRLVAVGDAGTILTSIPEPGAGLAGGVALATLALLRRGQRRKRSKARPDRSPDPRWLWSPGRRCTAADSCERCS